MSELQATTRVYIAALSFLAVSLTVLAVGRMPIPRPVDIQIAMAVAACTGLAWLFPIHFAPKTKLYADTAVMAASVLLLPPGIAAIAMGSGTLLAHAARRDSRDFAEALFNTAKSMLITLAAALVVGFVGWEQARLMSDGLWALITTLVLAVVIYLLNIFFLATITASEARLPFFESLRGALAEDPLPELAAHASLVTTGVVATIVFRTHSWGVVLLTVPIVGTYATLRHQAQLRQSAERARLMSDAALVEAQRLAHLGSWEWYPATDRWVWSDEVYSLLGLDPRAGFPTFRSMLNAVHPDDRVRVQQVLHEARHQLTSFALRYRIPLPDGTERFVHQQAEAQPLDGDSPVILGTIQDVTEQVRTEGAIREAKEAAEEADRAKSHFLSMASHELRTPLTAIQGYIEMVVEDGASDLTDEQREFLGVAHRNTLLISRLVNDLLDLARIEAGRLPLDLAAVDVQAAAKEVLDTLMPHATAKGIRLEFDAHGSRPQVALADPVRLSQVLLNLAGNAVKFTERGAVTISTRAEDGWVEITVSDTGPGIPAESLPYVFEAFNQGRPTGMRHDGAGLGLSIVKQLVDLHGGTIAVHSLCGKGSTFTLRLPAASRPTG